MIGLVAFAVAAVAQRDGEWVLRGRLRGWMTYLVSGLLTSLALEFLAIGRMDRWAYSPGMPTFPLLGIGMTPVLQWMLLPPVAAWLTARHMAYR